MKQVIVDGEAVIFEGNVPDSPSRVYELLIDALSEQGKVVTEFIIDGKHSLAEDELPLTYEKIEAASLTHDELTLKLVIASMNQLSEIEVHLDAYIRNILSIPWSEVFKRMDELINKVHPFAELVDNLGPYVNAYTPPWMEDFKEIAMEQAKSLNAILDSFEQGNPSRLSDELSIRFIKIFKQARKLFSEEVIPYLKARLES
jgi:hypothetical protein